MPASGQESTCARSSGLHAAAMLNDSSAAGCLALDLSGSLSLKGLAMAARQATCSHQPGRQELGSSWQPGGPCPRAGQDSRR